MIISAKYMKSRVVRICDYCRDIIGVGTGVLRLYGVAHEGDKPYTLYLHRNCTTNRDPKILDAFNDYDRAVDNGAVHW